MPGRSNAVLPSSPIVPVWTGKNFAQLLPKSVPKNKPDIYDPGIEDRDGNPGR